jgi:hypothetical protein
VLLFTAVLSTVDCARFGKKEKKEKEKRKQRSFISNGSAATQQIWVLFRATSACPMELLKCDACTSPSQQAMALIFVNVPVTVQIRWS